MTDRFDPVRRVADAVLFEGYVLYPYRASSAKNQVRWQFGVLAPRSWSEAGGSEAWRMRTECILDGVTRTGGTDGVSPSGGTDGASGSRVDVRVRCLQVEARTVEAPDRGGFHPVAGLEVDGRAWTTWDGAVTHEIDLAGLVLDRVAEEGYERLVELPGDGSVEVLRAADGTVAGRVVTRRWPVAGVVRVGVTPCDGPYRLARLSVTVENVTAWPDLTAPRAEALRRSMVAVHTMVAVDDGRFISQIDPPEFARTVVEQCANTGTFPVLAGPAGTDDLLLSAPIILYDHPEVAPESQGDLCDATEIDEILALRILTLTDEEKAEVRGTDDRAAAILDRCELMPPEVWDRLHGAVRSLRPVGEAPGEPAGAEEPPWWDPEVDARFDPFSDTVTVGSAELGPGSRVILRPGRRADAQDLFLVGRAATVAGVFHDVDAEVHLAVVLDDDPAAELHQAHGRYLYFHPDEVEPLGVGR